MKRLLILATAIVNCAALAACGGGGSGSDGYVLDSSGVQNTAGVDIRDTWKPTGPIRSYFDLEEGGTRPSIAGFNASSYNILGSKDGITYGQQMSGPTNTIDIDFTGYFDQLPDYVRGAVERAGKSWSYRLRDVLGPHLSYDEVITRLGRAPDEDNILRVVPRNVDGILIDFDSDFQNPAWDFVWGYSRGRFRTTQVEGNNFTVRTGWIEIAAQDINRGSDWLAHMASHEMGHAIGHTASELNVGPNAHPDYREDTIARYVDFNRGIWTGPAVTAANGGRYVPFQELDGEIDFGHLGACVMIMSYCGDPIEIPHEMDFAFMRDIGYTVEDSYPTEPEQYSYGAWAEHSAWEVLAARTMRFSTFHVTDRIDVEANVFGTPSSSDFANAHTGTLTWNGSLLAADLTRYSPVFGNAQITLSADDLDGTAEFTDLRTVRDVNGQALLVGWRRTTLAYDLTVGENGFMDADENVNGTFYGPNHEEVAGILSDDIEHIHGAFGGTRGEG
ncbi:MAG: hypothetical protein OXO52_22075 [Rhodospirillales bacterium]|nr:hypothetical protein [Rhodospirillales bacterium]MDE0377668.1 hypothetical protein [Rhodospirillales bacterium]